MSSGGGGRGAYRWAGAEVQEAGGERTGSRIPEIWENGRKLPQNINNIERSGTGVGTEEWILGVYNFVLYK